MRTSPELGFSVVVVGLRPLRAGDRFFARTTVVQGLEDGELMLALDEALLIRAGGMDEDVRYCSHLTMGKGWQNLGPVALGQRVEAHMIIRVVSTPPPWDPLGMVVGPILTVDPFPG